MVQETTLQTISCAACGTASSVDDRFCTQCGQDRATTGSASAHTWQLVPQPATSFRALKKTELALPEAVTLHQIHSAFKDRLAGRYRVKPDDPTAVSGAMAGKGDRFQVKSSFLIAVDVSVRHSQKTGRVLSIRPGARWASAATTITTFLFMIISLIVMASGAWLGIGDILFFVFLIVGFGVLIPLMSRPLARRLAAEAATWPEIRGIHGNGPLTRGHPTDAGPMAAR